MTHVAVVIEEKRRTVLRNGGDNARTVVNGIGNRPRNALVFLKEPERSVIKTAVPKPPDVVTNSPSTALALKAPFVGNVKALTAAAAAAMKPTQVLQAIDNAVVELTVPGIPGKYGHGLTRFEVDAGTQMTVKLKIEGGRVIPEESKIIFEPKLGNKLWIKTSGITLEETSPGEAKIELALSGFPDLNVTKKLLDMETIPTALSEIAALLPSVAGTFNERLQDIMRGMPFDAKGFQLGIGSATFKEGHLPLGAGATLALAPGNTIAASGNKDGLRLQGALRIAEVGLEAEGSKISGKDVEATATVFVSLKDDLQPRDVLVSLRDVKGTLAGASLRDQDGNMAEVRNVSIEEGVIGFAQSGEQRRMQVSLPKVKAELVAARLTANDSALMLGPSTIEDAALGLEDGVLTLAAERMKIEAHAENLTLGQGAARIAYASADITGGGKLAFDGKTTTMAGVLALRGVVEDAQIGKPGTPFSIAMSAGANINVTINEVKLGAASQTFRGSGDFNARIDRGSVLMPNGQQLIITPGSTAIVKATSIDLDAEGLAASGDVTIQTGAELGPAKGSTTVNLTGVQVQKDGAFSIASADAELNATVSSVTGKLRPQPSKLIVIKNEQDSKILTSRAGTPALALSPPTMDQVLKGVADCDVDVAIPVPSGSLGLWPLQVKVAPGTKARFKMPVKDGVIQRDQVRLVFEPAIDGPLWIEGTGIKVDKRGHFIVDLKGLPNVDVSKLLFGQLTMPQKLTEMPGWLAKIDHVLQSSIGRLVSLPSIGLDDPLALLEATKADFKATNVRMNGTPLTLGPQAQIIPGDKAIYTLAAKNGVMTLSGRGAIKDGRIDDPRLGIKGMQGEGDLEVTVRGRGDEVTAKISKIVAKTEVCDVKRENGDAMMFRDVDIQDATIVLTSGKGKDSQVNADFHQLNAKIEASRFTARREEAYVTVEIPDGAFSGTLSLTPESLKGSGHVTGLQAKLPELPMGLAGLPATVTGGTLSATGEFSFDDAGRMSLTGVDAKLDLGELDFSNNDGLTFAGQEGSTASLRFDKLELGTSGDAVRIDGKGNLDLSLAAGRVSLGNGASLDIAKDTAAQIVLSKLEHKSGDAFGTLEGAVSFEAKLSGKLPTGGIVTERGSITAIGENNGRVFVTVNKVGLKPDGTFTLEDIALALSAHAKDIAGKASLVA